MEKSKPFQDNAPIYQTEGLSNGNFFVWGLQGALIRLCSTMKESSLRLQNFVSKFPCYHGHLCLFVDGTDRVGVTMVTTLMQGCCGHPAFGLFTELEAVMTLVKNLHRCFQHVGTNNLDTKTI